jgi:hypothetical protein
VVKGVASDNVSVPVGVIDCPAVTDVDTQSKVTMVLACAAEAPSVAEATAAVRKSERVKTGLHTGWLLE